MRSLDDVVQATPGLRMAAARPANSEYFSRGFPINNLMFDGLPTTYNADWVAAADMAPYDRVEIVLGATGLMQGAGNPSAAINMVRKRPTREFQASVTASAGSWDNYRSELDVSGPLNANASVRGRFVGAYQDKDSFQDYAGRERGVFYGISEFDLTDNTTLTLGASDQNDNNNINWGGLPVNSDGSHANFSRSKTFGYSWSHQDVDNKTVFAELDHRFDNDWRLHLAASKNWSDFSMTGAVLEHYGPYQQRVFNQARNYDQSTYDAYATGPFSLFGRQHELVVGASRRDLTFKGKGLPIDLETHTDLNHPSGIPKPDMSANPWTQYRTSKLEGTYVTTRLNITDDLKVILGGRLDWYDYDVTTAWNGKPYSSSRPNKVTRHLTRYAGAIYDLDQHHSVYVSYTDIFKPQSVRDASKKFLEPVVGSNYEVGLKGSLLEERLNLAAAYFWSTQDNVAELDNEAGVDIETGEQFYTSGGKGNKVQGFEVEASGEVLPDWNLTAGYTYTHALKGNKQRNVVDQPMNLLRVSTSYRLPGEWRGLTVGGAVNWQSDFYAFTNRPTGDRDAEGYLITERAKVTQQAYTVVNLMSRYQFDEHVSASLNVNNLFDKKYYERVGFYNGVYWGDPRSVTLALDWKL